MFDRHLSAHGRTPSLAVAVLLMLALPLLGAWDAVRPADAATKHKAPAPVPVDPAKSRAMRAAFDSAVVDTHVSREGQQVLETIPDPLGKSAQVPPPAMRIVPDTLAHATAAPDSIAAPADSADTEADTSGVVPMPEEVQVLGDFSMPVAIADSLLAPSQSSVPTGGFGELGTPVTTAAPQAPDSCWGIQIAAPTDAARAETIRAAAASLLLVPMRIDQAEGRFRVQTRDCVSGEVAEKLRARAVDSGFGDAFRIVNGAALKPPARPTSSAGKKPKKK